MKNIILSLCGFCMAIYTILSCLGIYSVSSRKNEMENCLSTIVSQYLENYYHGDKTAGEIENMVRQDLTAQLASESKIAIHIYACDMENGLLSVGITEKFYLPNGMWKEIKMSKTAVVE